MPFHTKRKFNKRINQDYSYKRIFLKRYSNIREDRSNMSYSVLFFDSGVGGLSVYQEVIKKYSGINSFYLFDNLCFPYGIQPDDLVVSRVVTLLSSFYQKFKPDLIVIACNTASTVALEAVRKELNIPIVGVVPAIKPAAKVTPNGVVGLLATPATIRRSYTNHLIKEFAENKTVLKIGSTELVDIAERKLAGLPYNETIITSVLSEWIDLDDSQKPGSIVLGCTHFPHLRNEIQKLFPNTILVDSGEAIARRVLDLLHLESTSDSSLESTNVDNTNASQEAFQKEVVKAKEHNFSKAYYTDENKYSLKLKQTFEAFGFSSLELFKG